MSNFNISRQNLEFTLEDHIFHFKSHNLLHTKNKKNALHLHDSFIQQSFKNKLY